MAIPPPLPGSAIPPVIATRRPRVWTVFVMYGATLVAMMVASAIVLTIVAAVQEGSGLTAEKIQVAAMSGPGMLFSLFTTMLVATTAAIAGALLSPEPWRRRLRLCPATISLTGLVVICLGGWGIGFVMQALTELSLLPRSEVLAQVDAMIRSLPPFGVLAAVVIIGVMPGIAEELLFRGYIQTRFRHRWGSRWAVIWTALMFGVMHMDPVHSSFAVIVGLYLGYLTERTGSILPAMVCHAGNNVVSTLLSAGGFTLVGSLVNILAAVTGGLLVLAGLWKIRQLLDSDTEHGTLHTMNRHNPLPGADSNPH